jgi:hypothetical protein
MMGEEKSRMSTFKRVMDGVNNRKPSTQERVDHAKMKAQTKATTDRAKEHEDKNTKAIKAMDRRNK